MAGMSRGRDARTTPTSAGKDCHIQHPRVSLSRLGPVAEPVTEGTLALPSSAKAIGTGASADAFRRHRGRAAHPWPAGPSSPPPAAEASWVPVVGQANELTKTSFGRLCGEEPLRSGASLETSGVLVDSGCLLVCVFVWLCACVCVCVCVCACVCERTSSHMAGYTSELPGWGDHT